jgi:hypothetical protein
MTDALKRNFADLDRSLPYRNFRYVYPPRIENALPPELISKHDDGTYIAQPKLNGDCMTVYTNGTEFEIWDRSAKPYGKAAKTKFDPNSLHRESEAGKGRWMAVVGEFMAKGQRDSRGENFNGNFVIFDLLVYDGVHLTGTTFEERRKLLDELYGTQPGVETFLYSTPIETVHRVVSYNGEFDQTWNQLTKVEMIEGMVIKSRNGQLGDGPANASNSQLKFRQATKNFLY